MPARCARWDGSKVLPAIHPLWGCFRHGDRPLYDSVSLGIFELSLAPVGFTLSRIDQSRFGQSLHAYVRNFDDGWVRPKP